MVGEEAGKEEAQGKGKNAKGKTGQYAKETQSENGRAFSPYKRRWLIDGSKEKVMEGRHILPEKKMIAHSGRGKTSIERDLATSLEDFGENTSMECEPSEKNNPLLADTEATTDQQGPQPMKKSGVAQNQPPTTKQYDPVEHIKDNFHHLPKDLHKEMTASKYRAQIPVGTFFLTLQKGNYGLPEQRFGRFLYRNHTVLLRQFVLYDLSALQKKGGVSSTQARPFFFRKNGIQNSVTLKLIDKQTTCIALQHAGKKEERKVGGGDRLGPKFVVGVNKPEEGPCRISREDAIGRE